MDSNGVEFIKYGCDWNVKVSYGVCIMELICYDFEWYVTIGFEWI